MRSEWSNLSIFDNDDTLGINWGSVLGQIGGASAQTGLALLFGPKPPRQGGPLKSQGEIAAALDQMYRDYQAALPSLSPEQHLQLAIDIRAWLDSPQVFDQGKASKVAYFLNVKRHFEIIIAQLRPNSSTPPQTGSLPTAQTQTGVTAQTGKTPTGGNVEILGYEFDGKILLLGGAAVVAIILMRE